MKEITIYKEGEIIFHSTKVIRVIRERSGNLQVWEDYGYSELYNKCFFKAREYDWFEVE